MRVVHFVSGSFGTACQVALDVARDQMQRGDFAPLLVLRHSRSTDPERVAKLRDSGLPVEVLPSWSHWATFWALLRLLRREQPTVLVAHGYPEHAVGRWAAWWARVPHWVQVEHNPNERYVGWRRWQMRFLGRRTDAIVAVAEPVKQRLLRLGLPEVALHVIPSGIDLSRFAALAERPFAEREPGIVMSARFARQKDHLTLLRALALLRDEHGLQPSLQLAGAGKASFQARAQAIAQRLNLLGQVRFLGYEPRIAELLASRQIFVLSTHQEGMPLALIEAMAAGCACVATLVPGVDGVLEHERTGLLVPPQSPALMAAALQRLLTEPGLAERLGAAARAQALAAHGLPLMRQRYAALLNDIIR